MVFKVIFLVLSIYLCAIASFPVDDKLDTFPDRPYGRVGHNRGDRRLRPSHQRKLVTFSARRAAKLYKSSHYGAIGFQKVDVNDGSFNSYTGIFTAPHSGLFFFAYHFLCHFKHPGYCRIALVRKDSYGREHEIVHSWGTAGKVKLDYSKEIARSNNANNQYILWLRKGDKVYLKLTKGLIYENLHGRGSTYSTFLGYSLGSGSGSSYGHEDQYVQKKPSYTQGTDPLDADIGSHSTGSSDDEVQ